VSTGRDKLKVEPKEKKEGRHHGRSRHHRPALYFIHNDHLGTPQRVTDADQRIVWSMSQTPFGEVVLTTEGVRMLMRFPGQFADIESGFSYNYLRDYDSTLGRYIQGDPIGQNAGANIYGYVSSPIRAIDPFGLDGINLGASGEIYGTGIGVAASFRFSGVSESIGPQLRAGTRPAIVITGSLRDLVNLILDHLVSDQKECL